MGKQLVKRTIDRSESVYKESIQGILNCIDRIGNSEQDNPDKLYYAQKIKISSMQLARATSMIADHARLSSGLYQHKRQCFDLVRFVRGIVRTAAPYALQTGITFDYKLPPHPMITVTESEPLMTILSHLLSNACLFHAPGNRVSVTMHHKNSDVLIIVWDRGPGIPNNISPHIFDANFSFNPYDETLSGNGLGLTIAKQLAEFIDGSLDYGPNIQGSFFRLTLPLRARKRPRLSKPPIPADKIKIIMSDTLTGLNMQG